MCGVGPEPCLHEVYEIKLVDLQNKFSIKVDVLSEKNMWFCAQSCNCFNDERIKRKCN